MKTLQSAGKNGLAQATTQTRTVRPRYRAMQGQVRLKAFFGHSYNTT
ncbi:MAG: hypothetical protein J0I20_07435 [Chloroflexi bacterium]|nr:hypothetical protein [Chloroflexota bacterium]